MDEAQTAENIKSEILKSLSEFDISPTKVFSVTTDNGANVVSACRLLYEEYGWYHITCAAHTIQLCIEDGLKIEEISFALAGARHMVQYFRRSTKAMTTLRHRHAQDGTSPSIEMPIDVSTR
ncbi:E3 SUMO-protein ligase ZBED1-like [Styela clava]